MATIGATRTPSRYRGAAAILTASCASFTCCSNGPELTGRYLGVTPENAVFLRDPAGCLYEANAGLDIVRTGRDVAGGITLTIRSRTVAAEGGVSCAAEEDTFAQPFRGRVEANRIFAGLEDGTSLTILWQGEVLTGSLATPSGGSMTAGKRRADPLPPGGTGSFRLLRSCVPTSRREEEARALLRASGVQIDKPSCPPGTTAGCADVACLRPSTIEQLVALARACSCIVLVTGGSEGGHSLGGTHNHMSGHKVDLAVLPDQGIERFLRGNRFAEIAPRLDTCGNRNAPAERQIICDDCAACTAPPDTRIRCRSPQWRDPVTGAIYAWECKGRPGREHWDILYPETDAGIRSDGGIPRDGGSGGPGLCVSRTCAPCTLETQACAGLESCCQLGSAGFCTDLTVGPCIVCTSDADCAPGTRCCR